MNVHIKDDKGTFNTWIIEEENEQNGTLRVSYIYDRAIVTDIYRSKCYIFDGKYYSNEIRNIKFKNGNIGIASFIQIEVS
jgi:hypothetical protein